MDDIFELKEFTPAPSNNWPNRYRVSLKGSELNILKFKSVFGTKTGSLWKSEDPQFSYSFYIYSPSEELVDLLNSFSQNKISTYELLEKLGVNVDFMVEEIPRSPIIEKFPSVTQKTLEPTPPAPPAEKPVEKPLPVEAPIEKPPPEKPVPVEGKNVRYIGIVSEVEVDVNVINNFLSATIKEKNLHSKISGVEIAFVLNYLKLDVSSFDGVLHDCIEKNVKGVIVVGYADTDIKLFKEIAMQNNIKFLRLKKEDINKRFWCLNFIVELI